MARLLRPGRATPGGDDQPPSNRRSRALIAARACHAEHMPPDRDVVLVGGPLDGRSLPAVEGDELTVTMEDRSRHRYRAVASPEGGPRVTFTYAGRIGPTSA